MIFGKSQAYKFMMARVAGFIMIFSVGFGVKNVVDYVSIAEENSKPENTIIIYTNGDIEELDFSDAFYIEEEEEQFNDVNSEEEQFHKEMSDEEWFMNTHNNNSPEAVRTAYQEYLMNRYTFGFPYGSSTGALASYFAVYPGNCYLMATPVGNADYFLKPLDDSLNYQTEGCVIPENLDDSYEVFAKVTYEERNGGWYIASDETCSMSYSDFDKLVFGASGPDEETGYSNESELFTEHTYNSSLKAVNEAYIEYLTNRYTFGFPYGSSSSGALASYFAVYPGNCSLICTYVGNTAYYSKSPDESMNYQTEGCEFPENYEDNYITFAKVTYEERNGVWYLVSDEACSMTLRETDALIGKE